MKKWFVKEDLPKIRPWLLLSVLVILFYLGVSNFTKLLAVFDFLLDLFQPLLLAIAFAYILNVYRAKDSEKGEAGRCDRP